MMSSDTECRDSIEELKAELSGLERSILAVRYEDFKKVVLTRYNTS
jgi:hypothetical protein